MVRSQALQSMTISGLAQAAGVGVETVRYYQRRGLLVTPARPVGEDSAGSVRRYGDDDLRKLDFIRSAKAAGFTLEQIKELLDLDATDDRTRVRQLARERITALESKIEELDRARRALTSLAKDCESTSRGPCPILTAFEG
jgi:MerR family mercuric resistance operon transcriptional regulator